MMVVPLLCVWVKQKQESLPQLKQPYPSSVILQYLIDLAYQVHANIFSILAGSESSVKGSNAFFSERASLSTLPFAIDDPP